MLWLTFHRVRTLLCLAILVAGCAPRSGEHAIAERAVDSPSRASAITPESTSASAAATVVREYYSAIAAREFRHAYQLWENEGAASGKRYGAFALGFASTADAAVAIDSVGSIEGAAGSRYVEIAVTIRARTREGRDQSFAGAYVLRRSVVDGATAAQQRWHIYSARVHRTQ